MNGDFNVNPDDLTFAMFVLPPVIALINQKHWRDEVRALVAMGVCLLYSAVITLLRQDIDWTQWRDTVIQVFVGAFGAYQLFWKPSDIAPAIESATTLRRPPEVTETDDTTASQSPDGTAGP